MDKKFYEAPEMEELDVKIDTMLVTISNEYEPDIPAGEGDGPGW